MAETIVAWGVLATLFVLVLQLLPTCILAYRTVQQEAQAQSLGSTMLQTSSFGELKVGEEKALPPVARGDVLFYPSYRVREQPGVPVADAKRLEVTVSWEFRGRSREWRREVCLRGAF